jgi:hypothetical protein
VFAPGVARLAHRDQAGLFGHRRSNAGRPWGVLQPG